MNNIYKWCDGPQGPLIVVLATDLEHAKSLARDYWANFPDQREAVFNPDGSPSEGFWINFVEVEVIPLDQPRVICTA